mgnify:CR=1 FL=1
MEIVSQIENMVPRDSDQSSPTAKLIRDMKQMVQKDMISMVVCEEAKEIKRVQWMMKKVPCETEDNIRIVIDLVAGSE